MKSHAISLMLLCFLATMCAPSADAGSRRHRQNGEGGAFARALADARKAGLPTEPKDLQPPLPPTAQNAAPIYTQLSALLKARPLGPEDRDIEQRDGPLTADRVKLIRDAQHRRSDIMSLIHRAAGRPQCVFASDWSDPTHPMWVFASMRAAARDLRAESLVLAWDGKPLEAIRNQALGFRMARHAESDGPLISYLVGNAIDAITLSGMQQILYHAGKQQDVDAAIQSAIAGEFHPGSLSRVLRTEMGTQMINLRMLRRKGPGALQELAGFVSQQQEPAISRLAGMNTRDWNRFLDDNGIYMLQEMRKMIPVADRPYSEANRDMTAITTKVANADSPQHLIGTIVLPIFSAVLPNQRARIQAMAAVTSTGAAVLAWKSRHSGFPPDLKSAMQQIPADPFDGKPLRYRRTGTGFVVYSIGPTGKFDGGRQNVKPTSHETRFIYPEPVYPKTK